MLSAHFEGRESIIRSIVLGNCEVYLTDDSSELLGYGIDTGERGLLGR